MTIKVTYNVTDVYMSQSVSPVYINVSYSDGGASGGGVWGSITGTLSNQTDLQTALDLKVPYSGATANVNLGEYELKAGQVTLDTSPTGTAAVGTIRWNDTTGTSETTLKGGNVIIKNGVDLVARVVNKVSPNTTLTKAAYQAVRVSGAQGQRLAVAFAQANNDANSADTIGLVIETIPTNQEGFIMTVGQLEGINTTGSLQGETWVDGDVLYLSPTTAGAVTNVKPTAVIGHIVVIGYVEYAHQNNGKIYVKVMNGWELDELHNVSIVTPTNNQGLFYNSSNSLWENKSIATVLGYTPEQPLTFNSPLSRAGNVVSIPQATGSVNGFLSATDWTTFNSKQAALGYTPANAATTLTINGVTYDLSANRSWTISTGISGSGASGQVTYWTGASAVSGSNNLFWDNANGRLGIGTNAPAQPLHISGSGAGGAGRTWMRVQNTNTGSGAGAQFINGNNRIASFQYTGSTYATGEAFSIFTESDYPIVFSTNGAVTSGGTSYIAFSAGGYLNEAMRITGTKNLLINTTTDSGQRLQVYGDTLLRGSGATSATTALTVQNSSSTNLFTVRNDGLSTVNQLLSSTGTTSDGTFISGASSVRYTSNTGINTSGIYTSAANLTGDVLAAHVSGSGVANLYLYLQSNGYIGTRGALRLGAANGTDTITSVTNTWLNIAAGTTTRSQINLASSTAPTTPNNGDIWFDGTAIKMRIGGVTKTFTLV